MRSVIAALLAAVAVSPAAAHVVLTPASAVGGQEYRGLLEVDDGCQGQPTTGLRVLIPEGIAGAEPVAKGGWTTGSRDVDVVGSPAPLRELSWTGGRLQDGMVDWFVFTATLPAAGGALYFPVLQECGDVVQRWIEVPFAGEDPATLLTPAPWLRVSGPEPPVAPGAP